MAPDTLVGNRAGPHGRVLSPLLVAATVAGIAIAGSIAQQAGHPSQPNGRTDGDRPRVRPGWSYARGIVTAVDVTVVRTNLPTTSGGAPTVLRTLTGAAAELIAALLDSLPAEPLDISTCPALFVGASDTLLFHTGRRTVQLNVALGCGDQATISDPGGAHGAVYVDGTDLNLAALRALGRPRAYGLH